MDEQLIQRSRYVLKTRIRRAKTCPINLFPSACNHFLNWANNHPIFSGSLINLRNMNLNIYNELKSYVTKNKSGDEFDSIKYAAATTNEHAAICLFITEIISGMTEKEISYSNILSDLSYYLKGDFLHKVDEQVELLRDVVLDGIYEYLDEQIDSRNALYGIILKYKQRSEWFQRKRLREICTNGLEGKTGERALAIDLQEYVFNQGVEFYIEPSSASGEVDLIIKASEGKSIIIDAKYIKPEFNRSEIVRKISSGFHQVMKYCADYNEHEGYLVTFSDTDKKIDLELDDIDSIKFLRLGSKIIYHLFVDISDSPPASKSGKAEEVIVSANELKEIVS